MKISVVIPVYNRPEMVVRAIESVRSQTLSPYEIVVVDDGSTDRTPAVLRKYDSLIRSLRTPNRGVAAARNAGVAIAEGEWIAFLDSDDMWDPKKLEIQSAFHKTHPDILISHTAEIWIKRGRRIFQKRHHEKPQGWCFYENLPFCKIAPSSVMIARTLFEKMGGFDETFRICEDYDLWLRITRSYFLGLIDVPLVTKYGGHRDQLSATPIIERHRIEALRKHLPDKRVVSQIERKMKILWKGALRYGNSEVLAYLETVKREIECVKSHF